MIFGFAFNKSSHQKRVAYAGWPYKNDMAIYDKSERMNFV